MNWNIEVWTLTDIASAWFISLWLCRFSRLSLTSRSFIAITCISWPPDFLQSYKKSLLPLHMVSGIPRKLTPPSPHAPAETAVNPWQTGVGKWISVSSLRISKCPFGNCTNRDPLLCSPLSRILAPLGLIVIVILILMPLL